MNIIRERITTQVTTYLLNFPVHRDGRGYSFSCDENGVVDTATLPAPALANYQACREGAIKLMGPTRVEQVTHRYTEPRVGLCDCGAEVELSHFTNTCGCGADYNSAGQLLADRSQWGEETGESVSDILAIDGDSTDELLDGDG